jgi:hypothetical protein
MVHVELRTPIHDRDSGTVRWEPLVALEVHNGHEPQIEGDRSLLDLDMPVVSLRSGETIHFADNPEEWARSLVLAYRAGDLVAAVVHDDDPVSEEELAGAAGNRHGVAAA